jgi:uncharacterized protein with HEPN domain
MRDNRDINILEHIVFHCDEISYNINRFGDSFDDLRNDRSYKPAVVMHLMQIGELTSLLTDEFKTKYPDIPWKQIKAMRNFAAHNYAKLDLEILWSTITINVPILHDFCLKAIKDYEKDLKIACQHSAPTFKLR